MTWAFSSGIPRLISRPSPNPPQQSADLAIPTQYRQFRPTSVPNPPQLLADFPKSTPGQPRYRRILPVSNSSPPHPPTNFEDPIQNRQLLLVPFPNHRTRQQVFQNLLHCHPLVPVSVPTRPRGQRIFQNPPQSAPEYSTVVTRKRNHCTVKTVFRCTRPRSCSRWNAEAPNKQ